MSGCPGWESVNPVCRAGQLLGGAAHDVFASIANYFGKAAQAAVAWLWDQLDSATAVNLTGAGLATDLVATGAIAAVVTFGLFLIQVIASGLRQDPGGLGRAVRGLGIAFIGAAFAIASTQLLLAAVDALANGVVHFALGTNVRGMGGKLVAATALSGIGNPAGLLLMSLVLLAAVVIIWGALMIRKLLIIVAAVFAPLAFSGASADITRSWVRRWIEFSVALIFAKLILVIIFMIGLSVLDGTGQARGGGAGQSVTQLAIGGLTLLLAGFAPWIAIRMVHFAGESFAHVHAQAVASRSGASTVVAAPQKLHTGVAQTQAMRSTFARLGGTGTSRPSAATEPAAKANAAAGKTFASDKAYAANTKGFTAGAAKAGSPGVAAAATVRAAGVVKDNVTRTVSEPGLINSGRPDTLSKSKDPEQSTKGAPSRMPPRPATPN